MAADFSGDANATPLSKLPPPVVQPKGKGGVQFDVPNYADIAKAAYEPPHQNHPGMPGGGGGMSDGGFPAQQYHQQLPRQQQQQQQMMMPQVMEQPRAAAPSAMEQQLHQMARQMRAQQQELKAARRESYMNQHQQQSQWLDWRRYKPGLLVSALVLVMLVYGVPRIKTAIPHLVSPMGRLNHVGFVVVALLTGAAYQASSKFVLQP